MSFLPVGLQYRGEVAIIVASFMALGVGADEYERELGSVPEWLKGMGCKPIGVSLRWFESNPAQ